MSIVLNHDVLHHFPTDISEPETAALKFEGELFVVDTHQMHYSSLKIVNMDRVFNDVIAEIVSLAISPSPLNTSSSHPDGKTFWMMVTAVIGLG